MFPGLLTSQKNELFRLIEGTGFDHADFEWKGLGLAGTELCYRNFIFRVYDRKGHRDVTYTPGDESRSETHEADAWGDFSGHFAAWPANIKREIAEPDLWEQLNDAARVIPFEIVEDQQNQPFTEAEADRIVAGLNEIRQLLLKEAEGNLTQQELIKSRLDYLIRGARKHGKIDWLNIAVSTLIQTFITLALAPEQAHRAMMILKASVAGIVKLLGN